MDLHCEHNAGSMFALGPCEDCKKKMGAFYLKHKVKEKRQDSRTTYQCIQADVGRISSRVQWADDISQPLEIILSETESKRQCDIDSPRPILKHKQTCIVIISQGWHWFLSTANVSYHQQGMTLISETDSKTQTNVCRNHQSGVTLTLRQQSSSTNRRVS